jgi:hypothetical protein
MNNPDVIRLLMAEDYCPHLARVCRFWHDQHVAMIAAAKQVQSQVDIVNACLAGDWTALVRIRDRGAYYRLQHTRNKVHMFCSFKIIRLYELIFFGARPHNVLASLRKSPNIWH